MKVRSIPTFILALAGAAISVRLFGRKQWNSKTRDLYTKLRPAQSLPDSQAVDFNTLPPLPEPVRRYFITALKQGQPLLESAVLRHQGTFNMGHTQDQWKAFSSEQKVVTKPPGFVWNASIKMLPGMNVHVHDAYMDGEGILHATMLGLFDMATVRGKDEIAKGELMRYLAEAVWYPTALLPHRGLIWEAVNNSTAKAILTDGKLSVALSFHFDEQKGVIDTVTAESRGRMVDNKILPTPWEGRFWDYREQDGMQVPYAGEVAWILPEGRFPYWRGGITQLTYRFANSAA